MSYAPAELDDISRHEPQSGVILNGHRYEEPGHPYEDITRTVSRIEDVVDRVHDKVKTLTCRLKGG